jgi:hypothetical protein
MMMPLAVAMLIAAAAQGANTPAGLKDFLSGQTSRFSSQGHAKSLGVNFTIRYPRSWRATEAERPHTIQNFFSADGSGANCNIVISDTGMSASDTEVAARPNTMRTQLPTSMTIISSQSTTLGDQPAGEVQYKQPMNVAGQRMDIRGLIFATAVETRLLIITCSAGGETQAEAEGDFQVYVPIFRRIAGSIVFPDRYR